MVRMSVRVLPLRDPVTARVPGASAIRGAEEGFRQEGRIGSPHGYRAREEVPDVSRRAPIFDVAVDADVTVLSYGKKRRFS
jgi:hypothetical protein